MRVMDLFRVSKIRQENVELARRLGDVQQRMATLEGHLQNAHVLEIVTLRKEIDSTRQTLRSLQEEASTAEGKAQAARDDLRRAEEELARKRREIIRTDEQILLEDFALYTPRYRMLSAEEFKSRLAWIREEQIRMIQAEEACVCETTYLVNGKESDGRRMVRDYIKLILRAFNVECESAIDGAKAHTAAAAEKRIQRSHDVLNRRGKVLGIRIVPSFLNLKMEELSLAVDFQIQKQKEKEEQRALRDQAREEAKLQRDLDESRERAAKEEEHFRRALRTIERQIGGNPDPEKRDILEQEKRQIEDDLAEVQRKKNDIEQRFANARAGYVYVISNIGAFGEGVVKIGVTRRLDPMDRIDELGDASVPFAFDVHAMVFSSDAYALESALHKAFDGRRVNKVNGRKEFFRASVEEIEQILRLQFGKPVEITRTPEATEGHYRFVVGDHEMWCPTNLSDDLAATGRTPPK